MYLGRFVTGQCGILLYEEFQLLNAVSQSQDDTPFTLGPLAFRRHFLDKVSMVFPEWW